MDRFVMRACLLTAFSTGSTLCLADITETTESTEPTEYCVPETLVRGGFENLVIDHNMIIPPEDHFKSGDIFVGALLKSQPEALWLLSGITWRKIDSADDLHNSQHQYYNQLPLLVPVSIFNSPFDARGLVGDVEIWIGYGLRSITESTADSFNEMTVNQRQKLLWTALPPPYRPATGVRDPYAHVCLETTKVRKVIHTLEVSISGDTVGDDDH